jgi:benzylsuccinate CoA-transferase BbsF subunit
MVDSVFDGINVLDLGTGIANPLSLRYLADYGATVVCVESVKHPSLLRTNQPYKNFEPGINRSGYYANLYPNIYSITLDLDKADDRQIAEKLAMWADIVGDSHRPGVAEKWGMDYEKLKKINPDIIMIRSSNQGLTGPRAGYRGFGNQLNGLSGFVNLCGMPDEEPVCFMVAYTDYFVPCFAVAALVGALDYRRRTGKGQLLDISQLEVGLQFLSTWLLNYSTNGIEQKANGNRCDYAAPHGAYQCAGEDRWCAISVFTDAEWKALCDVMGNPKWALQPEFQTLLGRKKHEDQLDQLIGEWTAIQDANKLMHLLQKAGIAAGVVQNARDLFEDPQLKERHNLWVSEHKEMGNVSHQSQPAHLSKTPAKLYRSAPLLGEHNDYVIQNILGINKSD